MKEARTIYHSQPFVIHGGTSRNPSFSSVSSFFLITPNLVSRIQIIMNLNLYNLVSYPQSLRFFIFIYIYKFVQELTVDWGTNLQKCLDFKSWNYWISLVREKLQYLIAILVSLLIFVSSFMRIIIKMYADWIFLYIKKQLEWGINLNYGQQFKKEKKKKKTRSWFCKYQLLHICFNGKGACFWVHIKHTNFVYDLSIITLNKLGGTNTQSQRMHDTVFGEHRRSVGYGAWQNAFILLLWWSRKR
jgi:hypothetical protein